MESVYLRTLRRGEEVESTTKRVFLKRLESQGTTARPANWLVMKAIDQVEAPTGIVARIHDLCAPDNMQELREELELWIGAIDFAVYGQGFDDYEQESDPEEDDLVEAVRMLLEMLRMVLPPPDFTPVSGSLEKRCI